MSGGYGHLGATFHALSARGSGTFSEYTDYTSKFMYFQ